MHPPSSDDNHDDFPCRAVQLNAVQIAGGMASSSNSKHRLHILPVGNILSMPSFVGPPPIPTERDVKSTSNSSTPSGSNLCYMGGGKVLVDEMI